MPLSRPAREKKGEWGKKREKTTTRMRGKKKEGGARGKLSGVISRQEEADRARDAHQDETTAPKPDRGVLESATKENKGTINFDTKPGGENGGMLQRSKLLFIKEKLCLLRDWTHKTRQLHGMLSSRRKEKENLPRKRMGWVNKGPKQARTQDGGKDEHGQSGVSCK